MHAVYTLAPGLLLVFKPRGHAEAAHVHAEMQRLTVLRGSLMVAVGRRRARLGPGSRPLAIPARRPHTTHALADTWLVVAREPLVRVRREGIERAVRGERP